MSCPYPRTAAPPCLPLNIKDSLKEDGRLFAFGFYLRLLVLAFGLLGFWLLDKGKLFDVGDFGREQDC
jgi:hypothetical protein